MKPRHQDSLGVVLAFVVAGWLTTAAQADVFTDTGSLGTEREDHTATLLTNGTVLVAGGDDATESGSFGLDSAEVYDPVTGTWSLTGSLATAGELHTATLLPNGKVLVAGGFENYGFMPLATAELYDPITGTWSSTGALANPRYDHTATLLPNGKVLVAGGAVYGYAIGSAELYDPATGAWSLTGSLANERYGHTATLLLNGKVLVAGGEGAEGLLASAELYDPVTGTWSSTGSLSTGRYVPTATLLPDGKVLVAGGNSGSIPSFIFPLSSAELYDPASGTWSPTGSFGTARESHTATLLPNGKVLAAGGFASNFVTLASAELYDPAAGTWSFIGSLGTARYDHTATLLPNGQVLIAAGYYDYGNVNYGSLNSAELYESTPTVLNRLLNPIKLGDGSFQFGFNNPSGLSYHVLASTDINTWSDLGPATETPAGSGRFQFTDHQASNYPQRFYRVTSP